MGSTAQSTFGAPPAQNPPPHATQIFYRIGSERAATLCRAVCMQIAVEFDGEVDVPPQERLAPLPAGKA